MNTTVSYTSSRPLFIILCLVVLVFALFPELAHASGGLNKVNDFMEDLAKILRGASIVTVTVALMWIGYKYQFTDWDIREFGRILMGALLIGGAAEIARYFVS
ncbi:attachment mediating protein VirB2-like protein (plasmid) [Aliivibrio fischeri ES114]|uniref:Attachment mediating protein VirB2-like protein n=1 Tax=Aliivibrio fischeri (strain ATCC 700601 / ES114) TaxID=312309 RepID=Q5DY66_ALIF1|nr:TrbC/VirB2 family protein [Aliivibrio fischeri]AAW88280.1 attachment mediating protein VirB2-like protein [Aliivibrio fischeri ES114]KLU77255.1 type IV secretion protein A [Aliivibrio fischeri]MCE7575577.1 TrbC/VirB2 family protein [Aliivibrio fischeri]MUK41549.1 type IV secretion protein A [Aliivibrio fischeri]